MPLTRSRVGDAMLDQLARPYSHSNGSAADRPHGPEADVIDTGTEVLVILDVPGIPAEQIDLTLEDHTLTVAGERPRPQADADEPRRWLLSERRYGRFTRSFTLPPDLDADGIRAQHHEGVLEVRIPKRSAARRRRIEVRSVGAEAPRD